MADELAIETLTVTLSERDKRKLRMAAATRGVSMRAIVRELIRDLPGGRVLRGTRDAGCK
jgi:hypothetical protein